MKNKPDGIKFVHQEALRECSVKSSPELRNFFFRVLRFMDLETKKEALREILLCEDVQHARRAGKILGEIREAWAGELLDIALQDDRPEVRYAALCGSSGRNASWLVPRLQKAVADPESSIRNYASRMLQSFPGLPTAME